MGIGFDLTFDIPFFFCSVRNCNVCPQGKSACFDQIVTVLQMKGHSIWNIDFFNPLPDYKIVGLPKLKAFADDKLNVTENIKVVFHRMENIAGKEENAAYQHFLLFPQCFQKAFSSRASKVVIVW